MIPAVIAHRGASALARHENTLEAFHIAIQLHADYAEFDIRMTSDHKMIAFHNPDINGIPIHDLTYEQICKITGNDGYRVPLLREVLEFCQGKIKLDIELKEAGYEQRVIRLVKQYYDYSDFMMKSFIDRCVYRIKQIDPKIHAGLLLGREKNALVHRWNEYFPLRRICACKADFVSPNYQFVTKDFVRRMHFMRKQIFAWTVNDCSRMRKLFKRGVDGIISDRPDLAMQVRKSCMNA